MDDAQPCQFTIVERIKHPDFKLPSKYNDIALVKINDPVQFSNYVRPACLPHTKSINLRHVIASGWGRVNYGSTLSEQLQKVVLELFTTDECNKTYSNEIGRQLSRGIDVETQLCAGSHNSEKDTCQVSGELCLKLTKVLMISFFRLWEVINFFPFHNREIPVGQFKRIIHMCRVCTQSLGSHRLEKNVEHRDYREFILASIHICSGSKTLFGPNECGAWSIRIRKPFLTHIFGYIA